MKRLYFIAILTAISVMSFAQGNFTLMSKELKGQATQEQLYNSFGCTGKNLSPQLYWVNAPSQTQSFAVTMYDPDAPTGSGWWHWVVFNIPHKCNELPPGAGDILKERMPKEAIQSINDFGQYGYGGPCPPLKDGIHQYIFTVYALNVPNLDLTKDASPAMVGFYLNAHTIQKASIVVYYKRD